MKNKRSKYSFTALPPTSFESDLKHAKTKSSRYVAFFLISFFPTDENKCSVVMHALYIHVYNNIVAPFFFLVSLSSLLYPPYNNRRCPVNKFLLNTYISLYGECAGRDNAFGGRIW